MTIRHSLTAAAGNTGPAPAPTDPQFNYVSLLLHGDGTNGAQNNTFVSTPITAPASGYFAGYFDGSGDYLTAAGNSAFDFGTGDFTIEFFANMSLPSAGYVFLLNSTYATTSQGLSVRFGDSGFGYKLQVGVDVSSLSTVWSCSLTQAQASNAWLHIAFTRSSGVCRLFVNGVVQNINSGANPSTYPFTSFTDSTNLSSSTGVKIGDGVLGYMSNVRVIKGTALYTANFTPPTAPLTAISGTSLLTCMSGTGSTFSDLSTNNFTITRFGNATMTGVATTPPGAVPYAGFFAGGSSDYLTVANNAAFDLNTGDYTVEFWFNTSNVTSVTYSILGPWSYPSGWLFQQVNNAINFYGSGGNISGFHTSGAILNANQWTHVAVTRSGSASRMFVNGVLVSSTSVSINSSSSVLGIGINPQGFAQPFNGYLSNVRIVKGTAVYTSNFAPPNSPLTAITNTSLLTCQSATFIDNSPNNFTITVNGNTTVTSSYILPAITRNGNTTQGSLSPYGNLWSNFFDGSGDHLTTGSNQAFEFGTGDWTIEFWINSTQTSRADPIGWNYSFNNAGWAGMILNVSASGQMSWYEQTSQRINATSTGWNNGSWNHVAVTRSGNSVRMFLNGTQQGSTYTTSASYGSNAGMIIGNITDGAGPLNGYISNLRVVKGTAVYTSAFTPPTAPLTAISGTSLLTCQSNRFRDASANNFTITRTGNVQVTKEAPFLPTAAYSTSMIGGSGYFDGTGDYLTAPSSTAFNFGTGDFTVEAWINPSTVTGTKAIMGIFQSGTGGWYFGMNGASLRFSSGFADYDAGTIVLGAWSHVAATVSGGNLRMYINGVQVNTTTNVSAQNFNITNSLWVGNINTAGWTFTGYISDPRVIKGVAVYTANFTPPTAPLTAPLNTSLLLNCTNAGIFDNAAENDLETVGNAQISTSVKKYGTGSLAFDGNNDMLFMPYTPNFALKGTYTIEAWIYPTTTSGWRPIFTIEDVNTANFGAMIFAVNGTSLIIEIRPTTGGSITSITGGTVVANTWQHVAISVNATSARLFLNGTQVGSTTTLPDFSFNPMGVSVGRNANGWNATTECFLGYIDDLRITKGYARYTSNFTPPTAAFPDQ
jgi:hypothetical protein